MSNYTPYYEGGWKNEEEMTTTPICAEALNHMEEGISAAYDIDPGESVPSSVRIAIYTLLSKAAYIETGLADEVAVVQAWAAEVTSITVSPATASVSSASPTAQLSAVTTPAGGAVTWASSNTAVATVSSAGLVTAVGNGTATITATSGTVSASCAVTVTGFATLTGIEATYTQSGTVYDTASLDDLKDDLVVTGSYDDSSTAVITDYVLSGTLATGTSTITVAYGDKTATFTVTVTHAVTQYSITNNLTNCTNSNSATAVNEETAYSGTLTATSGNIMSTVAITMGGTDITSTAYDSATGGISIASVTGNVVITAEAVEDVGWVSGVPYDMTDGLTDNMYLSNGTETAYNGWAISPYLPCSGAFIVSDTAFTLNYCAGYDAEGTYVARANVRANLLTNYDELGFASIRVSDSKSKVTGATITPYRLAELGESTVYEAGEYYVPNEWFDGGYINVNNGNVVVDTGSRYSGFMNCYNATKITDNIPGQAKGYAFYDGDKNFISGVDIASSTQTTETTIPSGARYFRCYKTANNLGLCFKLD